MKLKELIEKLQKIESEHGDVFVKSLDDNGCISYVKGLEVWAETVEDEKMKSGDTYVFIETEKQS